MKLFLPLAVALAAASPAAAAPMCASAALSNYLAAGFECEIDSAVFSNFSFFTGGGVSVPKLGAGEITVSPISAANQVGLRFSGAFEAEGGPNGPGPAEGNRVAQYRFIYDVTRANSLFFDATSVIDPGYTYTFVNDLKFGAIVLGRSINNDGASASAIGNKNTVDRIDTTLLFTPRESIGVDDLFTLTGGASLPGTTSPVGFVSAGYIENIFSYQSEAIPEPATWSMLLGAGSLLLLLRRRRR